MEYLIFSLTATLWQKHFIMPGSLEQKKQRDPEIWGREGWRVVRYADKNTSRATFPEYQTHSLHRLPSTCCCLATTSYTQAARVCSVSGSISVLLTGCLQHLVVSSAKLWVTNFSGLVNIHSESAEPTGSKNNQRTEKIEIWIATTSIFQTSSFC